MNSDPCSGVHTGCVILGGIPSLSEPVSRLQNVDNIVSTLLVCWED